MESSSLRKRTVGPELRRTWIVLPLVGVGAILFFASFQNWPGAWVAGIGYAAVLSALWWCLDSLTVPQSAAVFAGLAVFIHGTAGPWIGGFHSGALVLICIGAALHYGILGVLLRLGRHLPNFLRFFLLPILFTAYEYAKTLGFFGYPFLILGASQADNPFFFSLARIGGIWLSGFATLACGSLVGEVAVRLWKKESLRPLVPGALLVAFLFLGGFFASLAVPTPVVDGQFQVRIVQQNQDPLQMLKGPGLGRLLDLSSPAADRPEELVVWAESAILLPLDSKPSDSVLPPLSTTVNLDMVPPSRLRAAHAELETYLADASTAHLFGAVIVEDSSPVNAAVLWQPGLPVQHTGKQRLAPLSEARLPGVLGAWVDTQLLRKPYDWVSAEGVRLLEFKGTKIAVPICFEDAFPYIVRELANNGANMVITLVNGEWAGKGFLEQHAVLSRFRALESGLAVYRVGTNGISSGFRPDGSRIWQLPSEVELSEVQSMSSFERQPGFYAKHGDYFPLLCLTLTGTMIAISGLTAVRKRERIKSREGTLRA